MRYLTCVLAIACLTGNASATDTEASVQHTCAVDGTAALKIVGGPASQPGFAVLLSGDSLASLYAGSREVNLNSLHAWNCSVPKGCFATAAKLILDKPSEILAKTPIEIRIGGRLIFEEGPSGPAMEAHFSGAVENEPLSCSGAV